MEILKKILLSVALTLTATTMFSQNYQKLEAAFKTSYEQEVKGEYTRAIETLKAVYDENSYEINLRLGWLEYIAGQFSESMPYYQKCITLKPLSIEARLGLVNPTAAMGNWTQVENQYNKILEIDSQNSLVNYRLGLLFYGRKNYKIAEKYFATVVNHYPFDFDSMIMLAWTNYYLGTYRKAKILFQKALLNKPGNASAMEGLKLMK